MTPWERLGVDQSADKRDIKRAYSKLIKSYRPDESPTEFQEIREAYEVMLANVSDTQNAIRNPIQFKTPNLHVISEEQHSTTKAPDSIENSIDDPSDSLADEVELFFSRLTALVSRFPANGKLPPDELDQCREDTVDLMRSRVLNNWWAREHITVATFDLISQSIDISRGFLSITTNIPSQFLHYLDQHFLWSQNEIELREQFDNEKAGLVFYSIHEAKNQNLSDWGDMPSHSKKSASIDTKSKRTLKQRFHSLLRGSH